MATAVMKVEAEMETCCICGSDGGGELLTPEEHDSSVGPMQVPLRAMLLQLNNNKVLPDGRLCVNCIRRAIDAYDFSTTISSRGVPPLSEKIRALRHRLHELTQKIDVFIVVGGPGMNAGGTYSEEDIIMVDKEALAAATAADDEDLEKAKNARGDTVYQCSVCPMSFQRVSQYVAHGGTHGAGARHSCWTCGAQFPTARAAAQHAALHRPDSLLLCYLCNRTMQTSSELRRHSATCVGSGACPLCPAPQQSRATLSAHAAAAHGRSAPPPHLCPACFRAFEAADDLSAHMLTHRQADQYVCGYDGCILRFGTRGNLLSHIRSAHAGAVTSPAPVAALAAACPHCPRTFGSVAAMKRHVRVHLRADEAAQDAAHEAAHDEHEAAHTELGELADQVDGKIEYLEEETLEE